VTVIFGICPLHLPLLIVPIIIDDCKGWAETYGVRLEVIVQDLALTLLGLGDHLEDGFLALKEVKTEFLSLANDLALDLSYLQGGVGVCLPNNRDNVHILL